MQVWYPGAQSVSAATAMGGPALLLPAPYAHHVAPPPAQLATHGVRVLPPWGASMPCSHPRADLLPPPARVAARRGSPRPLGCNTINCNAFPSVRSVAQR